MKKQLLILSILLAFFAGISNVNAQCTPGPNSPTPGIPVDYTTTISGDTYAGDGIYWWYVTRDPNLLTGTVDLPADGFFTVGTGSSYNSQTNPGTTSTLNLTWLPASIGETFYLVLQYSEENDGGPCTAENIRVWEITPINTFLLAIVADGETCPGDVTGALVTTGTPNTVAYTYGTTTLTYTATASGVNSDWQPSIRIPALQTATFGTGQTYASAEWTQDGGTNWYSFGAVAGTSASGDFESAVNAVATEAGSTMSIRIVINNNNFESLADQTINVAIDGYLMPGHAPSDIVSATDCTEAAAFAKSADHNINARPTITTATGTFMTQTP